MNLVFSDSPFPETITKSIFLAGPTPREIGNPLEWRHEAVRLLEQLGYDGTIFIPEPQAVYDKTTDKVEWHFDNQVDWEISARNMTDIIVFWLPRSIEGKMPAFTTNFEIGEDIASCKVVYGRPDDAEKCEYIDRKMEISKFKMEVHTSLEETLKTAMDKIGQGALRTGGETKVPLLVWKTPQFQLWYSQLKKNGNVLDDAKVLSVFPYRDGDVYAYVLWTKIWITAEKRYKDNEFVFSRPNADMVLGYWKNETYPNKSRVVLIKEFRSPVNNASGYVTELPGGSPDRQEVAMEGYVYDARKNASVEFHEEAGIEIKDINRFKFVGCRQLMATVSSHKASVYKIELTDEEMAFVEKHAQEGTRFGVGGEQTYLVVASLDEIAKLDVDYSTLGMIYEALFVED